jgi:hypothetical protein
MAFTLHISSEARRKGFVATTLGSTSIKNKSAAYLY